MYLLVALQLYTTDLVDRVATKTGTKASICFCRLQIDEDELKTHGLYLDSVLQSGMNLIRAGNIGAPRIQKKIDEVEKQWKDLDDLSNYRRSRLEEAHNFYQVLIKATLFN